MNIKSKKIIAREFLTIIGCIILTLLFFGIISIHDYLIKSSIENDNYLKEQIVFQINAVEDSMSQKLNNQKRFLNLLSTQSGFDTYRNHPETWNRFEHLVVTDKA